MSRFPVATVALALALALAGCPLPQPLPDYPTTGVTPPRILVDGIDAGVDAVRLVPAGCTTAPVYPLTATLFDSNNIEQVEARWFVNYDATTSAYSRPTQNDTIPADPDPTVLTRVAPPDNAAGGSQPFRFLPYDYPPPVGMPSANGPPFKDPGIVRVVELVVSNGFDPNATEYPASPSPWRAALKGFETQVYRWTFVTVAPSAVACIPGDATCGCPP